MRFIFIRSFCLCSGTLATATLAKNVMHWRWTQLRYPVYCVTRETSLLIIVYAHNKLPAHPRTRKKKCFRSFIYGVSPLFCRISTSHADAARQYVRFERCYQKTEDVTSCNPQCDQILQERCYKGVILPVEPSRTSGGRYQGVTTSCE